MKVKSKLGWWLILLIILAAVFYLTPQATKHKLARATAKWVNQYEQAADKAHEDDEQAKPEDQQPHTSARMVVLDQQSDSYAGIETVDATSSVFQPQVRALARVVDLAPMVSFKTRYNQAQTDASVASVKAQSADHEYSRLEKLAADAGGVARKNVNYADAARKEAQAALTGARQRLSDLELEAQQQWGKTISGWLLTEHSQQLDSLLSRQQSLLLLTMPPDQPLPQNTKTIRVGLQDDEKQTQPANLIGPAFGTDQATIQGETYYFQVVTDNLRSGMRLNAWIPTSQKALTGVWVPEPAIIWYGGQAWAYVELKPGTYQRRSLKDGIVASDGIFMQQAFKPGDKLVVSGGQMLLSQEFKWQIQDGSDDD